MKIDFRILQDLSPSRQKPQVKKGAEDFSSILQKVCNRLQVGETDSLSAKGPSIPEEAVKLAEEIMSTLQQVLNRLEVLSPEELASELERQSEALKAQLEDLSPGSGKGLLEEVMILGVVEAQKLRAGFYS